MLFIALVIIIALCYFLVVLHDKRSPASRGVELPLIFVTVFGACAAALGLAIPTKVISDSGVGEVGAETVETYVLAENSKVEVDPVTRFVTFTEMKDGSLSTNTIQGFKDLNVYGTKEVIVTSRTIEHGTAVYPWGASTTTTEISIR